MDNRHTLFAGPWIGEFGWELFSWQGFLRKMAKDYEHVIVACRTGHDLLYADFADEIVHYDEAGFETDMWNERSSTGPLSARRTAYQMALYYCGPNTKVVQHDTYKSRWWLDEPWNVRQELMQFNQTLHGNVHFDVLMIVRDTEKCNTGFRNWPHGHARRFVRCLRELGLSVACVGKSESARCVEHAVDLRDIDLKTLAGHMNCASVIVGPQCGATHFATLCGLPQVCWQTNPEHATRMERDWNPFKVPVITMSSSESYWRQRLMWTPELTNIVSATLKILKGEVE